MTQGPPNYFVIILVICQDILTYRSIFISPLFSSIDLNATQKKFQFLPLFHPSLHKNIYFSYFSLIIHYVFDIVRI